MNNKKFTLDELFLCTKYPNYAFKLHKILNAYKLSTDKGYRLAKELIKSKDTFVNTLEKFKSKYTNASEFLDDLNDILSSYDKEEKKVNQYVDNSKLRNNLDERKSILSDIYKSGLSILDYSFYNNLPANFYQYFSERCYHKDSKALEISSREDKTMPILIDIIEKIFECEIDYVGYYELTKLNPYYLIKIAKDNNLYNATVSDFIRKIRENNKINLDNELNNILVIDQKEVPKEIKEQAIEYLKSIEAPIDAVNYNTMVRRLIKSSK